MVGSHLKYAYSRATVPFEVCSGHSYAIFTLPDNLQYFAQILKGFNKHEPVYTNIEMK